MSDVSLIVDHINTKLQQGNFIGKPFQKGLFNGLCDQVDRLVGEEDEKAIIRYSDLSGVSAESISVDDLYSFQLYHRVKSQKVEEVENNDFFGDEDTKKMFIFEMGLVVVVDMFNVELTKDEVMTAMVLDIPTKTKPSEIPGSQFSLCEITSKDIKLDSNEVFSQEFGSSKKLPQQFIMCELSYEIKLEYLKACYNLC